MSNTVKNFDILVTSLSVHNYVDGLKLFSNLYLAKFLDAPAKPVISMCLFIWLHLLTNIIVICIKD